MEDVASDASSDQIGRTPKKEGPVKSACVKCLKIPRPPPCSPLPGLARWRRCQRGSRIPPTPCFASRLNSLLSQPQCTRSCRCQCTLSHPAVDILAQKHEEEQGVSLLRCTGLARSLSSSDPWVWTTSTQLRSALEAVAVDIAIGENVRTL